MARWTQADKLWMEIFKHRGITLSKEWAQDEIARCEEDYEYFIDSYALIRNRAENNDALPPGTIIFGDVIDFKLYGVQREYLKDVTNNQNTVAIKTRQSGVSLTTGLYLLKRGTFEKNKEFIVISKAERESIKFLDELKFSQMYLPFFLRRRAGGNMKKLVLGNDYNHTLIRALPGGKDAGRSYTATMLILDEVAFIEHVESIWSAAAPVLTTTGGKAVMISTPWEDEGLFFDVVEGARDGINEFKLVEIPWESIPGRDADWYARECAKLQHVEEKIKTELDMQFISRGTSFFSMSKIKEKEKSPYQGFIKNERVEVTDTLYNGDLGNFYDSVSIPTMGTGYIYEFPQEDSYYVVSHDPAEDGTSSSHGITIFKVNGFPKTHPKIVLEWKTKSIVMDTLIDLSKLYNNCKVVVEKNRGYAVIMHFIAADAEDLLMKRPNDQYGLVTNTASRQILLKLLNKYFTSDVEEMPLMLLEETKGFRRTKAGKLKGKKSDDLLFAAGMGLLALATLPDMVLPLFEEILPDERLKLMESLKNVTNDRKIPTVTSNRYMGELKKRLFGTNTSSVTNLSEETMEQLKHLLPSI